MTEPNDTEGAGEKESPLDKLKNLSEAEIDAAMGGAGEGGAEGDQAPGETDVSADSSTAVDETTPAAGEDEIPKEFGKHPRWQQIMKERNEAREHLAAAEAEREAARQEATEARQKADELAYLKELDSYASAHPDRMEKARKVFELAQGLPEDDQTADPNDRTAARLAILESELAKERRAREAGAAQVHGQQRFAEEVRQVNEIMARAKIEPEDQQAIGEMIHSKYLANRGRGVNVSLAKVGKDVLGYLSGRESKAVERFKSSKTTGQAASTNEKTPTIRASGGRVPISNEAEQKRSTVERDSFTGRVDIGKTLGKAGKQAAEFLRQMRSGRP